MGVEQPRTNETKQGARCEHGGRWTTEEAFVSGDVLMPRGLNRVEWWG